VTPPEAEAEVGRHETFPRGRGLGSGETRTFPRGRGLGSGEAELPVVPEAELGRGCDLLLLVLPCWFAQ
jgi:hypothetical protein